MTAWQSMLATIKPHVSLKNAVVFLVALLSLVVIAIASVLWTNQSRSFPLKVYEHNFAEGADGWFSLYADRDDGTHVRRQELTPKGGFASFSGIGWLDQNHADPGLGTLQLYAVQEAFRAGLVGLDIANGEIRFRLRARDLALGPSSRLGLWLQTHDAKSNKSWNYIQRAVDIGEALGFTSLANRNGRETRTSDWIDLIIRLSDQDADWQCLGSSVQKRDDYDCAPDARAFLAGTPQTFGIIHLQPTTATAHDTGGAIDLQQVSISVAKRPALFVESPAVGEKIQRRHVNVSGTCTPDSSSLRVGLVGTFGEHRDIRCRNGRFSTDFAYIGPAGVARIHLSEVSKDKRTTQFVTHRHFSETIGLASAPLIQIDLPIITSSLLHPTLTGRYFKIHGTCVSGMGDVFLKLRSISASTQCARDRFVFSTNLESSLDYFYVEASQNGQTHQINFQAILRYISTNDVKIDHPLEGEKHTSQHFNIAGSCNSSLIDVLIHIGGRNDIVKCLDDRFSARIRHIGGDGQFVLKAIQLGSEEFTDFRTIHFNLDPTVVFDMTPLHLETPVDRATISARTFDVAGTCRPSLGSVTVVFGSDFRQVPCVAGRFATTFEYNHAGGNVGIRASQQGLDTPPIEISVLLNPGPG